MLRSRQSQDFDRLEVYSNPRSSIRNQGLYKIIESIFFDINAEHLIIDEENQKRLTISQSLRDYVAIAQHVVNKEVLIIKRISDKLINPR
jgi:hypothetical protein